jgi:hypothetical protein
VKGTEGDGAGCGWPGEQRQKGLGLIQSSGILSYILGAVEKSLKDYMKRVAHSIFMDNHCTVRI